MPSVRCASASGKALLRCWSECSACCAARRCARHEFEYRRSAGYRPRKPPRKPFSFPDWSDYTQRMNLLDPLFRSPAVEKVFTNRATLQGMLDFEAALARAEARAGFIPAIAAPAIEAKCRAELYDMTALARAAASAGNLAIPLVKQLTLLVAQ